MVATLSVKVTRQPFDPGPAAWNELLGPAPAHARLEDDCTADVVIIGASFAGLSAARRMQQLQPKSKIIVLEARRIGEGPAGRNSGFMIDLPHKLSSKDYAGETESDRKATAHNREAIAFARSIAEEFSMGNEAFDESGKTNAAATEKGMAHNLDYARHLASLGEAHELLDAHAMQEICGSPYYQGGLYTPGTVMLQPALYIRCLARGLAQCGVRLAEKSPVIALDRQGTGWRAVTPSGNVSAQSIVLAVNGHAESFGFFKRRLMHIYLYASMTRALSESEQARLGGLPRWGFTPADPMGTTVRRINGTGGARLVVRNRFTWSPHRHVSESGFASIAQVHDRSFRARFPQLAGVEMEYRWGGLLCLSRNTVPAFGQLDDGIYAACCQNGLGTAAGTLSGKLIAEMIVGHSSQTLSDMLQQDQPKKLPPEPFSSLGANAVLRWGEFRAGREL